MQSPSRSLINGLPRIDGKRLQSPSRDDSRALLRASLALLASVLTAAGFVLAAGALQACIVDPSEIAYK
ncbi:hypothetical protein [Halorubrum sp. DTA98]|uniref:hypothetical protein n=1 Tax=Halorubrum sp. DTA98 TaxID=3402163 RepID=UPI003AAF0447